MRDSASRPWVLLRLLASSAAIRRCAASWLPAAESGQGQGQLQVVPLARVALTGGQRLVQLCRQRLRIGAAGQGGVDEAGNVVFPGGDQSLLQRFCPVAAAARQVAENLSRHWGFWRDRLPLRAARSIKAVSSVKRAARVARSTRAGER